MHITWSAFMSLLRRMAAQAALNLHLLLIVFLGLQGKCADQNQVMITTCVAAARLRWEELRSRPAVPLPLESQQSVRRWLKARPVASQRALRSLSLQSGAIKQLACNNLWFSGARCSAQPAGQPWVACAVDGMRIAHCTCNTGALRKHLHC